MVIRERGDLRQMGHAQNLMKFRELLELAPHHRGDRAADSRINFVKNHGCDSAPLRLQPLEREHHARQFAARCDPRKRHRRLPEIGRDIVFHCVGACRAECNFAMRKGAFLPIQHVQSRFEDGRAHSQRLQFSFHPAF